MSKDSINVKSNGLRNELKEIRKSIDKLTNAIIMAQTNKRYEKSYNHHITYPSDGMQWIHSSTTGGKETGIPNDD
jgi:uncharacterized 2Fe-2S/4Fe-4S cluster protein (DUF4445 family)